MAARAVPLLETKLHAPRRRGVVARPRLRDRLDRHDQPALTLVSAGAGFGKTTLVAEWFADDPATAWLSLDRRDDEPAAFWTYVVAAVQSTAAHAGDTARALLQSTPPAVDAAVDALLNDLHDIGHDVVLVLDDYHVIESPEIHAAVGFLVDHLPSNVRLVIATRTDPPLALAALRAGGELLEIRAADLRFTTDEAVAYLDGAMGIVLAPSDVELLEVRTEGWIAALKLAALSMQGRDDLTGFIAEFAGDDRFILDYLVDEVLDAQSADVRRFLLETSILSRLTGGLCDAVTTGSGGRAMLEQLERENLFIVPLDDRRSWYRYHHLFAEVLRAHLLGQDPRAVGELHLRASAWWDEHGDPTEAIAHAIAGEHFDRAAELIEREAPALGRQRQEATLRSWLDALPADVFTDRPVLAITLVGARMASGDPAGIESLLDVIEATSRRSAPPPILVDHAQFDRLPAQILVYRAALALLAGDLDDAVARAARAVDLLEPTDDFLRGSATAISALAWWTAGDLATAERRYTDAISALIAADHLPDMLGCSLALADIQIAQGRLADATRTFESGLRWTAKHPGLRGAADMHVGLSEVLIERNDLDAAAHHLAASTALGDQAGLPQHAYRWRVTMARLCRARGDLDGALALLDQAAPLYDTDFSPPVRPVSALRARVQLAAGDLGAALDWVAAHGLTTDDDLTYVGEFEHITLARVLVARHTVERDPRSLEEVSDLLGRLLAAADEGGRTGSAIEILVLQAAALLARGDTDAAVAALDDALGRSSVEGHVRVFLHAGPAVTALLRTVAGRQPTTAHVAKVVAAADNPERATSTPSPLVDDLSAREMDVLRLLRSDLSGPDIARELVVSLNTVRTHTKNIYAKLGVNNRREAVRRAAELGLV